MIYELKNSRNGEAAPYQTTVEITEAEGCLRFVFEAEHSAYFCPHDRYNAIHAEGDACEIFITGDPTRRHYYEMEISANGGLMLGRITHGGFEEDGTPILSLDLIDPPFIIGRVIHRRGGYTAEIRFPRSSVSDNGEELYFNVFRIETDGGERDKHLFALNPTLCHKFHHPECFLPLKDML